MMRVHLVILSSLCVALSPFPSFACAQIGAVSSSTPNGPLATQYKPAADKLIAASLADDDGYKNLTYLCDHIGKRISGSEPLNRAIVWAQDVMKKEGLANVHGAGSYGSTLGTW